MYSCARNNLDQTQAGLNDYEITPWSLAVVAGMKKTNDHAEPTKVERPSIFRLTFTT